MSDLGVQPVADTTPGLSQLQRVTSTFSAPSKTFEDIKRGHRSWWLPFLIMVVCAYIFFAAITMKIGWGQVAENAIKLNPKAEERMAQAPPEQREVTMKFTRYSMEGGFAATPVLLLAIGAVIALGLWGTINFGFGGKATFPSVFVVWMFASLPGILKSLLGTLVIFAGTTPESFNLNNPAPTNVAAFLNPVETNKALYALASWLDFSTIWSLVLLGMGLAIVAGVKRSSGYIAVFGWWALFLIISVGYAAATS
jgi:hypothetical protein